jgi:hypothetical protein
MARAPVSLLTWCTPNVDGIADLKRCFVAQRISGKYGQPVDPPSVVFSFHEASDLQTVSHNVVDLKLLMKDASSVHEAVRLEHGNSDCIC